MEEPDKELLPYSCQPAMGGRHYLYYHYVDFMVVRARVLWTYVQRVYGRTSLGGKDVRPEGAWTYVHRTFERAWMGMNETCVKSIDSEQFLNGNEWDRGTRFDAAFPWHDTILFGTLTCLCATRCTSIYKGLATFHIRCSRNCQWDERRSLGVGVQALASNPLHIKKDKLLITGESR